MEPTIALSLPSIFYLLISKIAVKSPQCGGVFNMNTTTGVVHFDMMAGLRFSSGNAVNQPFFHGCL